MNEFRELINKLATTRSAPLAEFLDLIDGKAPDKAQKIADNVNTRLGGMGVSVSVSSVDVEQILRDQWDAEVKKVEKELGAQLDDD